MLAGQYDKTEGLRFCILSPCHVPRIIASA